jgi:prephenate dehydrogenase (NADP+)
VEAEHRTLRPHDLLDTCKFILVSHVIPYLPLGQLFRLWLGISEYVYRNPELLDECIDTAITDNTFRADDLEFTFAARAWSELVNLGNMDAYREKFEKIQTFFAPRFAEATKIGNEMIKTIEENLKERKEKEKEMEKAKAKTVL